jgi:hypothetical protein
LPNTDNGLERRKKILNEMDALEKRLCVLRLNGAGEEAVEKLERKLYRMQLQALRLLECGC